MTDLAAGERQRRLSDCRFVLAELTAVVAFAQRHPEATPEDYRNMADWIAQSDHGISAKLLADAWRATR